MNKILIDKEIVELKKITKNLDVKINYRHDLFGITKIDINVLNSCDLQIDYLLDNTKFDIKINVHPNVCFNMYEIKKGNKGKIQYTFNIEENSQVNISKYNNVTQHREMIISNLNGSKAIINYIFKSICKTKELYDLVINHKAFKTVSNIKNNAVNIDGGKVIFQVSSYVSNGIKNCTVNQNNRIINLTNNKCEIRPNLYIDEFDTVANHSALIGGFDPKEIFYLKSRGIKEVDANKLLITGFLLSDLNSNNLIREIKRNIKEYWR